MGEIFFYIVVFVAYIIYEMYKAIQGETGKTPPPGDLAPKEVTIDEILEQYLEPKKQAPPQPAQAARPQPKPQASKQEPPQPKRSTISGTQTTQAEKKAAAEQEEIEKKAKQDARKERKVVQYTIDEYEQRVITKQGFQFNMRDAVIYDVIMHKKYVD